MNWTLFFACGACYVFMLIFGAIGFPLFAKAFFYVSLILFVINFVYVAKFVIGENKKLFKKIKFFEKNKPKENTTPPPGDRSHPS